MSYTTHRNHLRLTSRLSRQSHARSSEQLVDTYLQFDFDFFVNISLEYSRLNVVRK